MKNKNTLSIVLATRNEEVNIGRCLDAIKSIADEIIVCDEASSDRTVEISKIYGAKIIHTRHQPNFHLTKNIAIDAATCDWILQLDADEVVSPELKLEIIQSLKTKDYNGYWLNRRNWFLYRFLTKGGQYPDPTLRLYRRGYGRLPAKDVHEQAVVKGEIGHLKNDLLHYRDTTFEKYLEGFNRYSSLIATQLQNIRVNLFTAVKYLIFKPGFVFLNIYIRHKGFVDGKAGFVFALYSGLIWPVAFIKLWQSQLSK